MTLILVSVAIPLLQKHLQLLLERYEHVKEQEPRPADLEELLTVNWMLDEMDKVISKGAGHLTKVSLESELLNSRPSKHSIEP